MSVEVIDVHLSIAFGKGKEILAILPNRAMEFGLVKFNQGLKLIRALVNPATHSQA